MANPGSVTIDVATVDTSKALRLAMLAAYGLFESYEFAADDLYQEGLARLGFDQTNEAYPILTPEGEEFLRAALGVTLPEVRLGLTDREAEDVHHALATTVSLMDQVDSIPPEAPLHGRRSSLVAVARRLDHERRHRGALPNPNGPAE